MLTGQKRAQSEGRLWKSSIRAGDARWDRVILLLAAAECYPMIEASVPCYRDYINRWLRFVADLLAGIRGRYRWQPLTVLTAAMKARVLDKTRQSPSYAGTHRSKRTLRRVSRIYHNLVA